MIISIIFVPNLCGKVNINSLKKGHFLWVCFFEQNGKTKIYSLFAYCLTILDKSSTSWTNQISEYSHKLSNNMKDAATYVKSTTTGIFNIEL